jgi:hypothetical protein
MFVVIEGDPEGMGEDDGMVGGVSYTRQADESLEAFRERLRRVACEQGAVLYFTGVGASRRRSVHALRVDGQTVEIKTRPSR